MITRQHALHMLLEQHPDASLLRHSLQSEVVLRELAKKQGHDEELWGLCGLLHDIDFPQTTHDITQHGLPAAQMLADILPSHAVGAIVSHNYENNGAPPPIDVLGWALRCGETVTGLVFANALVRPEGYVGMTPKSLRKKMKEKSFAAGVKRETLFECERIGLSLDEFFQIAIDAMTTAAMQIESEVKQTKSE